MSMLTRQEFICPISMNIMTVPVVLECGHTFDKDSLENWLNVNMVCPTCRKPVHQDKININWTLKSLIESLQIQNHHYLDNNSETRPSSAASNISNTTDFNSIKMEVEQEHLDKTEILKKIKVTYDQDSDITRLCLDIPESSIRSAVAFVCVIDVSGSMGSIVGAGEGDKAFTRLDLVKHVLNVLIVSLTERDSLALITFSNETKLLLDSQYMTEVNKAAFKRKIQALQTEQATYTGQAIQKAYEVIDRVSSDSVKSIILLTDGQDSEGYAILERRFDLIKKRPQVQFNTFGFSNDLWSDLLEKLALKGGGIFGFIPDQSMIGTIFINFIANTFQLFAQDVLIEIDETNFEFLNNNEITKIALKYDCKRNILLKRRNMKQIQPTIKLGFSRDSMIQLNVTPSTDMTNFKDQIARYKMLELIANSQIDANMLQKYEKEFKDVKSFLRELTQPGESDMNNEQIKLAFQFWSTWGAHYIRSFRFSHLHEQCLNFKSPSMKIYTNQKFNELVDNLTDLFCTLPPPKPTGINYNQNNNNQQRVNMRTIMNADAGCILASCLVKMINNESKQIGDLRKGDVLEDGSKVVCVLKTRFFGEMIKLNNLIITPYHPIIFDNRWQLPIDVLINNKSNNNINNPFFSINHAPKPNWVCTLVLDKNHVINAEGFKCIALGHGFTNEILKHDYYGTKKVIENLSTLKGWDDGLISLEQYKLERDRNGLVAGISEPVYS